MEAFRKLDPKKWEKALLQLLFMIVQNSAFEESSTGDLVTKPAEVKTLFTHPWTEGKNNAYVGTVAAPPSMKTASLMTNSLGKLHKGLSYFLQRTSVCVCCCGLDFPWTTTQWQHLWRL